MQEDVRFLQICIETACANVQTGSGGPFAALVVREGKIIGSGANGVFTSNDPTAHAEVEAIRDACRKTGSFRLPGTTLYCSCEPCPMCFGAVYWAGISRVVFAADRNDAADAGFDDALIYGELDKPLHLRLVSFEKIAVPSFAEPFVHWEKSPYKTPY